MTSEQGAEFVCEDNWGEQLTSVVDPVVVVMSVESEECEVVEVGENVSGEGVRVWGSYCQCLCVQRGRLCGCQGERRVRL